MIKNNGSFLFISARTLVEVLVGSAVLGSLLGAFFFLGSPSAQAEVTGVTVTDNDTSGFEVDGRDFSVSWTPGSTPAGYASTRVYILPDGPGFDDTYTVAGIPSNACGGNPCEAFGFFMQHSQSSFTLPEFVKKDSAGNALAAGTQYRACILTDADTDELACSVTGPEAFSPTSDSPSDTANPFIDHISVSAAASGTDAVFNAFVFDDQTTAQEFATTAEDAVQFFRLIYSTDNFATAGTTVNGTNVNGDLFKFTIASGNLPAQGQTLQYYLTARDKRSDQTNQSFFCANPAASTSADCQSAPFTVTIGSAGARNVTGVISSGGNGLSGAYVFPGGYAMAAATTASDGTVGSYTLSGLPNNNAFDVTATKAGYCKQARFETIGSQNLSGVNMSLNAGDCGFVGGDAGGEAPHVMFSGPPENAFGVPITEIIRVGMDWEMNSATINDADASDAGSNIYLTTDDGTTKIAGQAIFCASSSTPGCSAIPSGDTNTIVFSPASDLTANTFYTLVITEAVTSASGQSVQGNRPGGGHTISFTTGGSAFDSGTVTANFGDSGQYMPPYVRSMVPGPGVESPVSTSILLEFSERMNTSTITPSNIQLWNITTGSQVSLSAGEITTDSNEQKIVTINPDSNLAAGEYEVRVKGGVAGTNGMSLMPPDQASSTAFVSSFVVSSSASSSAPTVYPGVSSGSSIEVNEGSLEFGFSEPLLPTSVSTSNVTLKRGTTSVSISLKYNPGSNSVFVVPGSVLAPNTAYTVTFTASGVTSLAGTALASAASYTYTTGSADTAAPKVTDARCDDNTCAVFFSEPMNADTQVDSDYATSVLKPANITAEVTSDGAPAASLDTLSNVTLSYDSRENKLTIKGLAGSALALTGGSSFTITVDSSVTDLSGNAIGATNNSWSGKAEFSSSTFGSFGDMGMFGPPGTGAGQEFKAEGFGSFTSEQFAFGQADMAFPFNSTAGQDVNVFQVRFSPGVALQNDDQVVLTFPSGTGISSAVPDTFSPFYADMNEWGAGTVTFDSALDSDGVSVDTAARQVTVQLAVTGTPGANDSYTIDLRGITNPSIPKGPETGGYTLGIKVKRAGSSIVNKTSMPYFVMEGGSRSITVNIKAGNADTPDNVSGTIFLWGGGPSGPLDKEITITNGSGSAAYSSLPDGCYFFGTEPMVSLGGTDYFGQQSPESTCVDSTNSSRTKTIVLSSSSGNASVPVTVKFAGIADFGGVDIDVFAGGPGSFVVKTLSSVGAPDADGYTIRIPQDGNWFLGVGPAMPKGNTTGKKVAQQLPGTPPPPIDISVSGAGTGTQSISAGRFTPPGVSVDAATKTITFTFASADKQITGTVKDGSGNGLQNVEVFMHSQGFGGAPAFTMTDSSGAFTLNVSDYGTYELGAMKHGLPPKFSSVEVLPDDSISPADAGSAADIVFGGKLITNSNPLVITLKKASYTISGKVLDSSSNAISYAPVFAEDSDGNFVGGGTDSNGNYTLFVDAGTWTVRSELPPDKTDACGTFSKTVTVTTESKSSQNITPTAGTCYEISGTVTVGGSALANAPLFVEEWDTENDRPAAGGLHRGASTDSSGEYTVKVAGSKTYRVGTWDPNTGELGTTVAVASSNATANITASTGTITFAFTGGTSSMNAFVEVKKSDDSRTRFGKQKNGLDSNLEISVSAGTYNYFVDVFGIGKFTGTVATGSTATVNLSDSTLVTLGGTVYDNGGNALSGVLVIAKETTSGVVTTALTNSSGVYSMNVKTGTHTVSVSRSGYVPGQAAANVVLSANNAGYDFGGDTADQSAMVKAGNVISGTVYKSDGSTPASEGFITATNASSGLVVSAAIESDGTYSLPVNSGTWAMAAKAPRHAKTSLSGGAVVIAGSDAAGKNITLTVDATKESKSASSVVAAASGGSVDDTGNSGIKMTAGAGVLQSAAGNVTVTAQKSFTAPDTTTFTPLGDAAFEITATGTSAIKTLNGNADIEIDYADLVSDLPSGTEESDLQLAYYSPERGEYIPVEGGFAVDASNNKITAQTNHFTSFAVVYSPAASSSSSSGGLPAGSSVAVAPSSSTEEAAAAADEGDAAQEEAVDAGEEAAAAAEEAAEESAPQESSTEESAGESAEGGVEDLEGWMPLPALSSVPVRAEVQAVIDAVMNNIRILQAELARIKAATPVSYDGVPPGFAFGRVLRMGEQSDDVKYLQIVLKEEVGPPSYPADVPATGYFGPVTRKALSAFQEKYAPDVLAPWGIAKGTGYMGKTTREKLNDLIGSAQ